MIYFNGIINVIKVMLILDSEAGNYVVSEGKRYSYFAGNNYLGLSNNQLVKEASVRAIEKYGLNFSASRQTTGTSAIHLELEKQLSLFKEKEDSVIFASGYMSNRIMMQVLRKEYSAVFTDCSAHSSIRDGIPKDISKVYYYDHCNTGHLETLLKRTRRYRPLIISDGVFALTGEIAPLPGIMALADQFNALVIVDDAHATGILGKNGRGTPDHFNLGSAKDLFQTETMSKAFGSYGGFISGSRELIRSIRESSAIYQASTSLPPPVVAGGLASVKVMKEHPELRESLFENAKQIRTGILMLGFDTITSDTPIIPLFFRSFEKAARLSEFMKENNIIVPLISYPVKMDGFMLRITASVNHTVEQISELLDVLKKWRKKPLNL